MRKLTGLVLCLILAAFVPEISSASEDVGNLATINNSATITTGNTFQTVLAARVVGAPVRNSLTVENNNVTDNCWVFIGGGTASKANSILLIPGGSYTRYWPFVPLDAIQATCTSTSDTLYVDTQ